MGKYDSYIICTSPRSGSTLLCSLLAGTGIAGNPKSWFHDPSVSEWLNYFDLAHDTLHSECEILAQIFRSAINLGSGHSAIFGLRMQSHSFDFFKQKLSVLYPEFSSDGQRLQAAFGRILYIHLSRLDKVEQAVSYVKAKQSGLWHIAPDGTELERLSPPGELKYVAGDILHQFREMKVQDANWDQWFVAESINPFRLQYESLSSNPAKSLRHVLDELDLNMETISDVEASVAKLTDQINLTWVKRFRDEHGIT